MKKLFNTPKRAIISTVCITAVVLSAAVAVPVIILRSTLIGRSEAEAAALKDAGLSAADVSACRTELDFEDGRFRYEVDFYSDGAEYEYQILARDGDIISKDVDGNRRTTASVQDNAVRSEKKTVADTSGLTTIQSAEYTDEQVQSTVISLEEAKAAALADAGLTEADVTFTQTNFDRDDHIEVYDIEFYTNDAEYDYEVNAADAAIRQRNVETFIIHTDAVSGNTNPAEQYIGIDRAKEIAVNHVGLSLDQVYFSKAKLENDDGKSEYEVEFYHGNMEYDFNIDAVTGEILEYNSERE